MARSRSRAQGRSKGKPEPKRAVVVERKTRTEVEVVDEGSGADWETGVAILTGFLLLVAILVVDYNLGQNDAGLLF
jgi:hypothetical protein